MFFDINRELCEAYSGLDPIKLLDYPAEDVFDLICGQIDHNRRKNRNKKTTSNGDTVVRRKAGDNWF